MDTQNEQVLNEVETTQVEGNEPSDNKEAVETPAENVVDEIQIPENWESGVKDFINSIQDQSGRKAIFDKISNYEKGYQKKYQDLATQRKQLDSDKIFLDTYRQFENGLDKELKAGILAHYGNVPAYMNSLHQMDIIASKDPLQFVRTFCMNNGISAEQINGALTDNKYQQMAQTRSQEELEAQIMQKVEQKQREQRMMDEVSRFVAEKNEDGSSKHPMLADESFVADMDKLQKTFPEKSLEELYQMALGFRPEARKEALRMEAERIEKAKEVEKAKSVVGVKAKTPTSNVQEHKGWRSVVNDAFLDEE